MSLRLPASGPNFSDGTHRDNVLPANIMTPHWTSYTVPLILFFAASAIAVAVPAYMRRRTRLEREITGLNHDIERLESIVLRVVGSTGTSPSSAPIVRPLKPTLRDHPVGTGDYVAPGSIPRPRLPRENSAFQDSANATATKEASSSNQESSIRARRIVNETQPNDTAASTGRTTGIGIESRFVNALRSQAKLALAHPTALPCPYCHMGRIFQTLDQLFLHAKYEHASVIAAMEPARIRNLLKEDSMKLKGAEDQLSTLGHRYALDSDSEFARGFELRYKEASEAFARELARVDCDKARRAVYRKYKEQLGQLLADQAA